MNNLIYFLILSIISIPSQTWQSTAINDHLSGVIERQVFADYFKLGKWTFTDKNKKVYATYSFGDYIGEMRNDHNILYYKFAGSIDFIAKYKKHKSRWEIQNPSTKQSNIKVIIWDKNHNIEKRLDIEVDEFMFHNFHNNPGIHYCLILNGGKLFVGILEGDALLNGNS